MAGRKASDGGGQAKTDINILIFSWNVGNMMPDERELAAWLPDPGPKGYDWDIVAVGTQENAFKQKADKLNTKAESEFTSIESEDARGSAPRDDDDERVLERLPANATQKNREKDAYLWDDMVMKRLGRKYMRVKHVALWEMRLTVYAKAVWNRKIANVESSVSATGVAGLLGNKGGLVIRLDFGATALAFCSCHLAAHQAKKHLEQRNRNCQDILNDTRKVIGTKFLDLSSQLDHIFWFGDLNYRVDLNMGAHAEHRKLGVTNPPPAPYDGDDKHHWQAVTKMVEHREWAKLYAADQLRLEQEEGRCFAGFTDALGVAIDKLETAPTLERAASAPDALHDGKFPARDGEYMPTFKVKREENYVYKTQRLPSYCDRVLWKSMPPLASHVQLQTLSHLPNVTTSDHKPIAAQLSVRMTETCIQVRRHGVSKKSRGPYAPPLVRIAELQASNLIGVGSDPFCVFFSNPPGLFADDRKAPITKVKSIAGRVTSLIRASQPDPSATDREQKAAPPTVWAHPELPLLRPRGIEASTLPYVSVIIALCNKDPLRGKDTFIGAAIVPLCPDGAEPGTPPPEEYAVNFEQELTHGNARGEIGKIKGSITVSYAGALNAALDAAVADDAGKQATTRASRCCIL